MSAILLPLIAVGGIYLAINSFSKKTKKHRRHDSSGSSRRSQMKFSKTELDNMKEIDRMMNDLDHCGDKYCGNIITSAQIKEEGSKFSKNVTKKCGSITIPKNEEEGKIQREKYDKCFTKIKKNSNYVKKLTQRKKCEDENCSVYQKRIQKTIRRRQKDLIGGGKRKNKSFRKSHK